ncbi:MAG: phosphoribosylanthranilate isomerase [Rickettsiales bacterium]|nr:phosphoribosylanthranilate isomerase [Rickettsiales bacterium]
MTHIDIKICGINDHTTLEDLKSQSIDYIGFVIYPPSPRNVALEDLESLVNNAKDKGFKTVAVVVNPDDALLKKLDDYALDYVQFHGDETVEDLMRYKELYDFSIIKAFKIRSSDDIALAESFRDAADMYLFDAKAPKNATLPGGNGLSFDWNLLKARQFSKPWILSGGLNELNTEEALRITGALAVDVSSSIESAPGIKDLDKISSFVTTVKGIT